jgi:Sulfatase
MKRKKLFSIVGMFVAVCSFLAFTILTPNKSPSENQAGRAEISPDMNKAKPVSNRKKISIQESLDVSCPDCNVVLLTLDTVRADYLSCFGGDSSIAPNICEVGKDGWLFESAYSPAPWTLPALTAVMSHSLLANGNVYQILAHYENEKFLAEILAQEGYHTAGMTDHLGLGDKTNIKMGAANLVRGFETFTNVGSESGGVKAPELTDKVLSWLKNSEGKFFLWAHYFDPHYPFEPAEDVRQQFGYDENKCGRIRSGMPIEEINQLGKDLNQVELDCVVSLHKAEVYNTDKQLGRVLDQLRELQLDSKTIVIIAADHGEEFRERSRIGHEKTVYNELVHVPLVVKIPNKPVRRITWPVSTMLIHSIALGVISGDPVPLAENVVTRTFHFLPVERDGKLEFHTEPDDFAIVRGTQKFIFNPATMAKEFFDLGDDGSEEKNLWPTSEAGHLRSELNKWIERQTAPDKEPTQKTRLRYQATMDRLKKLGYMK